MAASLLSASTSRARLVEAKLVDDHLTAATGVRAAVQQGSIRNFLSACALVDIASVCTMLTSKNPKRKLNALVRIEDFLKSENQDATAQIASCGLDAIRALLVDTTNPSSLKEKARRVLTLLGESPSSAYAPIVVDFTQEPRPPSVGRPRSRGELLLRPTASKPGSPTHLLDATNVSAPNTLLPMPLAFEVGRAPPPAPAPRSR